MKTKYYLLEPPVIITDTYDLGVYRITKNYKNELFRSELLDDTMENFYPLSLPFDYSLLRYYRLYNGVIRKYKVTSNFGYLEYIREYDNLLNSSIYFLEVASYTDSFEKYERKGEYKGEEKTKEERDEIIDKFIVSKKNNRSVYYDTNRHIRIVDYSRNDFS